MENIIHNGKNIGKLFCSNYDYKAIEQLRLLSERPGFRYMYAFPDLHAGEIPVGHVTRTAGIVYYDIIGADIGCGVMLYPVVPMNGKMDSKIDQIANYVLDNFTGPGKTGPTIGRGNHFFEIATDSIGEYYFLIHSGSRGFGASMYRNIEEELKALNLKGVPIHTNLFNYMQSQYNLAAETAANNIYSMIDILLKQFNIHTCSNEHSRSKFPQIYTMHNMIRIHDGVVDHYKGASNVNNFNYAVIPLSMKEGSLVVRSISTSKLFNAINHGAGRTMSRSQAKKLLDEKSIEGINVISNGSVIDEAPQAYKNIDSDMQELVDLGYIEILEKLTPVVTVKD